MNTLIRHHRRILRSGYGTLQATAKCNKYTTTTHYRSPLVAAVNYRLDGGTNFSNRVITSRPQQLQKYAPALSTVFAGDRRPLYYNYNAVREFRLNQRLYENPSSKVEATVQTMKNKQKEKVEEILKEAAAASANADLLTTTAKSTSSAAGGTDASAKSVASADVTSTSLKPVPAKKPLKTRIWEEIVHYYHGFRLLFIDISICSKLCWRLLHGKTLTRRENKLLLRTTSDLFRLIPFSVFIIVPFMELLLPLFIKFFPGMLPSTFQTTKEREDKLKQSLQVRLEMAKFLQQTLDEMSVQHKDHKSEEAKQFAEFFTNIKDPAQYVPADDIIKFAKRFDDEITLDSLSRESLAALCRVLELNTMGTSNFLRFQLRMKLRSLAADDRVIQREGVNALDLFELQQACKSRGMRAYGLTSERLRAQLQEWIDLSLNEKVPPTLLLLSRAMLISDDTTTSHKLKETIRVLPDSVAAQTKAAIGEREGKIDNKTKIEIIKEEERRIKEEREEERKEEKAKAEILLDKAPAIGDTPIMVDKAANIDALAQATASAAQPAGAAAAAAAAAAAEHHQINVQPKIPDDKSISSKDAELLTEALKTLSKDKNTMSVEKETIKDIKEELEEYKEDVEELREVRSVVQEPVHESRAAKMLFKKVNSMIGQLDKVLTDLEQKHAQLQAPETPEEVALKRKEEDLVRIDELVGTIKKLKQTSDESRLKQIENVLSKIDSDKDGVISIDEVLKVVEAIGRDNVHLDEKQIEELLTLLGKEQLIEAEEKIEKALAKSIKEAKIMEQRRLEEEQKMAEAAAAAAAAAIADELKDPAPELKDKATDLSLDEKKHILTKESKPSTNASILEAAAENQKEKILPTNADISATLPPTIPPPTATGTTQVNPKDKML